jgi:hypothetical protein
MHITTNFTIWIKHLPSSSLVLAPIKSWCCDLGCSHTNLDTENSHTNSSQHYLKCLTSKTLAYDQVLIAIEKDT